MTGQQISIPDFRDVLLTDAQAQATELGIAVHEVVEGGGQSVPVEGQTPQVERNADGDDPGKMVPIGYSVGVILYPHEGRR